MAREYFTDFGAIASLIELGCSVTFSPIDPLNPQVGPQCIIEGVFGRVAGDSADKTVSTAFLKAHQERSRCLKGFSSNVQPIRSIADMVRALPPSGQESIMTLLREEQAKRESAEVKERHGADCFCSNCNPNDPEAPIS